MSWRDRITEALMGMVRPAPPPALPSRPPNREPNREVLQRHGIPLDDYKAMGDVYREDQPGMLETIDQMLRRPQIDPGVDPRLAPPPRQMLGVTPTNDRAVVTPDEVPIEPINPSYRYRA